MNRNHYCLKFCTCCAFIVLLSCNQEQNEVGDFKNLIRFEEDLNRIQNEIEIKSAPSIQDLQGNTYGVTQINDQLWTTKNHLQIAFNNGDPIPQAKKDSDWEKANNRNEPIWCYYNYDESNKELYGVYYNWHAINDPRGICPDGWQVATYDEVDNVSSLFNYDAHPFKDAGFWKDERFEFNQTGFSARPAGYVFRDGTFVKVGDEALFWTFTPIDEERANYFDITDSYNMIAFSELSKGFGLSVRLFKNNKP